MISVLVKRLQAVFLADAIPGSTLHNLERSLDIKQTIEKIKRHEWNRWDLQYLVSGPTFLFTLCIVPAPFILKLLFTLFIALLCLVPLTSQFFFRFLPIGTWLALFFSNQFIPASWRPSIYVRVLPALETILYGGDLSDVLASFTHPLLDLLAWIPYGVGHYCLPFVVSAVLFVFGPPKTLPVFAFAFGWNNFLAVLIQISFPTAPPWYQRMYGLNPANYGIHGSPGGLARIDKLFGVTLYSGAFDASPLVFGAFPSLHSGFAVMEALFLSHLFPKYTPAFFSYVLWIWWSTMYLTHHYFIDLICGAAMAFSMFYMVKLTILPRTQPGKFGRWSYDYIEVGVAQPSKFRKSLEEYELQATTSGDDDEDEESTIYNLPPLQTNFDNPNSSKAMHSHSQSVSSSRPLEYTHTHHKTSSYHLYDIDAIRSTSASSPHPMSPTKFGRPTTPDSALPEQRGMAMAMGMGIAASRPMSPLRSDDEHHKLA